MELNQAADALSRPPNADLYLLETASLDNDLGDIDEIIRRSMDTIPELNDEIKAEILGPNPTHTNYSESDLRYDKFSAKSSILNIPITDRSINTYKHQIVITIGDFSSQCICQSFRKLSFICYNLI